ncbi:MAG: hypothetical protein ACI4R9_09240 [Kiritimatiellia bacterium]
MREVIARVRLGFYVAVLPHGLVWGLAAAVAACSLVVLSARIFALPIPYGALALWIVCGALVGLVLAARGVPSREACRALADEAAHAGGLLLVAELPGARLWMPPTDVHVPPPPRRLKRPILALGGALALDLAAACVPLPPSVMPPPVVPLALMDAAAADIERLAEAAELSETARAEIREEVRRIVEAASEVGAAETVDALARVAERLRIGEARARETARRATAPHTAYPTAAESAALQQALAETLSQSPSSHDITEGSGPCEGSGEGEGGACCAGKEGCGESDAGFGGPAHGPGAAIISWTDPTLLGDSKLKDISREGAPTKADSVRIGEALDVWEDPSSESCPVPARYGSPRPRAVGATPATGRILPRHREAVRRYFSSERNDP